MAITIDDVLEINARLAGYYGYEICFANGMMGDDLDLKSASELRNVINEVINDEEREEFRFIKRERNDEGVAGLVL